MGQSSIKGSQKQIAVSDFPKTHKPFIFSKPITRHALYIKIPTIPSPNWEADLHRINKVSADKLYKGWNYAKLKFDQGFAHRILIYKPLIFLVMKAPANPWFQKPAARV